MKKYLLLCASASASVSNTLTPPDCYSVHIKNNANRKKACILLILAVHFIIVIVIVVVVAVVVAG